MTTAEMAARLIAAHISVIPVKLDGSKIPALDEWKPYQGRLATAAELRDWFGGRYPKGLGIVTGQVSGNLESIDFDDLRLAEPWKELVDAECPGLAVRLVLIVTPRPGVQFWYRCQEAVSGNQALAKGLRPDKRGEIKIKALIETRGEGGYAVAPGSPLAVHENGTPYRVAGGDPAAPPLITAAEREVLLRCARSLSEAVEPSCERRTPAPPRDRPAGEMRPGDDFNAREDFEGYLVGQGWRVALRRGEVAYLRRPGKDRGWSATLGKAAPGVLHVFTTSAAPLEDGCNYDLFRAYAAYEHHGDLAAAARELGARGYGAPPVRRAREPTDEAESPAPVLGMNGHHPIPEESHGAPHFTDLGNAYRLQAEHGADIRYCDVWADWLTWDGRRWQRDRTRAVETRAHRTILRLYHSALDLADVKQAEQQAKFALASQSDKAITAMVRRARALEPLKALPEQFDTQPWLFNVANGTLDLRTGELQEHRREDYLTQLCPATFRKGQEAPRWTRFLLEIMAGQQHLADFLQRAVGYSITGSDRERVLFILYGAGANGKSTFLDLIRKLMGDYGHKLRRETLTLHRMRPGQASPELAGLRGKRFAYLSETEEGGRIDEALVKELTGREHIQTRNLYEKEFGFTPEFTLWAGTNHKPVIQGTDEAIWDRLPLVPFPVRFVDPRQERVSAENPLLRPMDRSLAEDLMRELPGILAWAVEGCLQWQKQGLAIPEEVLQASRRYREESDFIQAFLDENTVRAFGMRCRVGYCHARYMQWCANNAAPALSQRKLTPLIEAKGFEQTKGTDGYMFWEGFGLQDD